MVKYICDRCGQEAIIKLNMPRKVKYWAMKNGEKISSFTRYEIKETHICSNCYEEIIDMFDVYEGGKCLDCSVC